MWENYAENLRQALAKHLPALGCRVDPIDITVKERPDGNYDVEVGIRTKRLEAPGQVSVDYGPTVKETYTDDEALETEGDAYREKTKRLAQTIRKIMGEA